MELIEKLDRLAEDAKEKALSLGPATGIGCSVYDEEFRKYISEVMHELAYKSSEISLSRRLNPAGKVGE